MPPSPHLALLLELEERWNQSSFGAVIREIQRAAELPYRQLTGTEITILEGNHNRCPDWKLVQVTHDFDPNPICHSHFSGWVRLPRFSGEQTLPNGFRLPNGIARCRIQDCQVGNSLLQGVSFLRGFFIANEAAVIDCGEVVASSPTGPNPWGLTGTITVGAETGGRACWRWPGLETSHFAKMAELRADEQQEVFSHLAQILARSLTEKAPTRTDSLGGVIGSTSRVIGCGRIEGSFLGPATELNGVTSVRTSCLDSHPDAPVRVGSGAQLSHCLLYPGTQVQANGLVEGSCLLEAAEVSHGGSVIQSVVGPNTHIAKGEVTSCLLGPFVGFHHQSLLIATLWPSGRGNVGYGANVGSNHTGKRADQEMVAPEGAFFGLGVSIKFPANYQESPHCLFATGIITLPQRVQYPFSLFNAPASPFPPEAWGLNELHPGWVWGENLFALLRNQLKYQERNRAHSESLASDLWSPQLAQWVLDAHSRLRASKGAPWYWEKPGASHMEGLGKNVLTETARVRALAWYEDYLHSFLWMKPQQWNEEIGQRVRQELEISHSWGHFAKEREALPARLTKRALESLRRDEARGSRIFPDYREFHPPVEHDPTASQIAKAVRVWMEEAT